MRHLQFLRVFVFRLRRETSGSVAIIFGFTAIVVVLMIGAAVDYTRAQTALTQLHASADAAVLVAAKIASQEMTAGSTSWQTDAETAATNAYNANNGAVPNATVATPTVMVTNTAGNISASMAFTAQVPTTFMNVMGLSSINVGGTSIAATSALHYVDIHVVIDNSESMGVGATPADQATLYNSIGCTLACHIVDAVDGPDTTVAARASGATLRIDVATAAVSAELTKLKNIQGGLGQIRVAIYTMSNTLVNVFALSSDLQGAVNAVQNIELANGVDAGGTNTSYSLAQLQAELTTPGDGSTSSAPKGVVIVLTDGVQNSIDGIYPANQTQSFTLDPNYVNLPLQYPNGANSSVEVFEGFDPSVCSPIKSMGYTMMTMYVQYVIPIYVDPAPTRQFDWIANNLSPTIPMQVQTCASSNNVGLSANSPADIQTAASTLFTQAIASIPHLTQ